MNGMEMRSIEGLMTVCIQIYPCYIFACPWTCKDQGMFVVLRSCATDILFQSSRIRSSLIFLPLPLLPCCSVNVVYKPCFVPPTLYCLSHRDKHPCGGWPRPSQYCRSFSSYALFCFFAGLAGLVCHPMSKFVGGKETELVTGSRSKVAREPEKQEH